MFRVWYKTHNWGHLSAVVPVEKFIEWLANWRVNIIRVERIEPEMKE